MVPTSRKYLLARFPAVRTLPWLPLGTGATPVEMLEGLSSALGREVWIKRDDLSGECYGGNKVRKLELLLAAAKAGGHESVLTVGGIGSNHVLATAVYGNAHGLKTHAVLVPQPVTEAVRENIVTAARLGVVMHPCAARPLVPLASQRAKRKANKPYVIAPGGSSALGSLGYLEAALELRAQIDEGLIPAPDDIFVPLGSGGTVAGLQLGLHLAGIACRLHAVRVVERWLMNKTYVRVLISSMRRTLVRHGAVISTDALPELTVVHDQFGGRYGRSTPAAEAAISQLKKSDDLALETTYTGKALAGMLEHHHRCEPERRFLFWNTYNSRDLATIPSAEVPSQIPPAIARTLDN